MAWQGIPFLFENNTSANDFIIALRSLPKIVVDSPPDYTNLVITALVSLVAGIIPAMIAVWTLRENAKNVKTEREKQQEFLRDEREKQHIFLEADRLKQQESFEEDRKTQIEVAKTSFNMQVLSGNRQEWINNLREVVSEYSSLSPRVIDLCCAWKIQKDCVDAFIEQIEQKHPNSKTDGFKEHFNAEKTELYSRGEKLNTMSDRAMFLQAKIKMMLNPKEDEYSSVIKLFVTLSLGKSNLIKSPDVLTAYNKEYENILDSINNLTILMQDVFKKEWERVKSGV